MSNIDTETRIRQAAEVRGWRKGDGDRLDWLMARLNRVECAIGEMRAATSDGFQNHIREERARLEETCAASLVRDGNAPNLDCGIDIAGSVMDALRREGVEPGRVRLALARLDTGLAR